MLRVSKQFGLAISVGIMFSAAAVACPQHARKAIENCPCPEAEVKSVSHTSPDSPPVNSHSSMILSEAGSEPSMPLSTKTSPDSPPWALQPSFGLKAPVAMNEPMGLRAALGTKRDSSERVLIATAGGIGGHSDKVDFKAAGEEATKILADYLKIDTTVPPGNEKRGAEFLAKILSENGGIESKILDTEKDRACIYARLKGTGKKKAVVLLNHIDVVPANAADWKHPPFCGEIFDGELWGRGALDMKGQGILQLEAMLMLKRSGAKLDRDIIFLATPDEEVGGIYGAGWFKKNHPELVSDAEFLINEGFAIEADEKGNAKFWGVNFAEKSPLWLELKAKGQAGHASMPLPDASTNRLIRALGRIDSAAPNIKVLPPVAEFFKNISKLETGKLKEAYSDIGAAVKDPDTVKMLMSDIQKSPMLRNTISLTVLKAGYKTNVIPGEATAQLDCRILPGVTKDEVITWMTKIIDDPKIELSVLEWEQAEPSEINTAMFESIKAVAAEEQPGIPVVPVVVPWFTDSHWFRELGITAYGFEPVEIDKVHMATMHGVDERIPVKGIENGTRRMYKILHHLCVSK